MSASKRDENRQVALILTNTLGTNVVYPTGVVLTNSTPMHVAMVDGTGTQIGTSTAPSTVNGNLTNNNAAPGANNIGVLPAVANAANPTDTEGNQVLLSTDLNSNLRVAGGMKEVAFTTTTVQAVATTEVSSYTTVAVHIVSQGGSSTITFQGSNDNTNWLPIALNIMANGGGNSPQTATTAAGQVYYGVLPTRYFRLNVTGISAGTTAGVIIFSTNKAGIPFAVPTTVLGAKTNNNAAPGATNVGALTSVANAAQQTWTEGNQVAASTDLKGNTRMRIQDSAGNDRGANVNASNQLSVSVDNTVTTSEAKSATATVTSVGDSATSVTLLASNANRKGVSIVNLSAFPLYLKLGTTASLTDCSAVLFQYGYYENFIYTGRIDGIWTSDTAATALITELT